MADPLAHILRPRIVIRAAAVLAGLHMARHARAPAHIRSRPFRRHLESVSFPRRDGAGTGVPRRGPVLLALLARLEADQEARRRSRDPNYRHGQHVAVLGALMIEARAVRT